MALEKYQEKRKFDSTPEPAGKPVKGRGPLRFVIQKHQARRLHYDFRLQMDGVLRSWAVPKGPSLNPKDRRLAMMVEDHPLEYRTFEGIIPEGNYGAGTVMVWDEGTYYPGYVDHDGKVVKQGKNRAEQDKEMRHQLHKGHLTFIMEGKKLKGEFALIKIKNSDDENAWLLLKKGDEFADSEHDITNADRSAATTRTMGEIAAEADRTWESNRPLVSSRAQSRDLKLRQTLRQAQGDKIDLGDAPKAPMLHDIKPMLATLTDQPFDRKDWLFEVKWDGYRAIAEVEHSQQGDSLLNVKLHSRNLQPFNQKFAPVVESLQNLGHEAVLDGEVVVVDEQGRSRFHLLQNYQKSPSTHSTGSGQASSGNNLVYYVFDILWLDGHDLTKLSLTRRKEILAAILPELPHIRLSSHIEERGTDFMVAAKAQKLEGIMAKNGQSPYRPGRRSTDWLKIKTHTRQEAIVGGFTAPRGSRKALGALVLGVYENDKLVYIGHTGGGFDDKGLAEMKKRLEPLIRKTSPFSISFKTNAPVTWVQPKVIVEVEFSEWTEDAHMRQPILVGVREDKDPKEVRREVAQTVIPAEAVRGSEEPSGSRRAGIHQPMDREDPLVKPALPTGRPEDDNKKRVAKLPRSGDAELVIDHHKLKLTHLDKVYWPKEGYTKGDLISYYRDMAPLILPYIKDRPESLNRHPNGINGSSFYQKDMNPKQVPSWTKTIKIYSESNEKDINYLICNDAATLVYMANLGCIEINPWNSRVQKLDYPDWLVMDLDPEDIGFDKVIETAQAVHEVLDRAGADSYPKTSGATGIHIYVPLGAKYDYDQAREFAHLVALLTNQKLPDITSVTRNPAKRQKRVYLDYLQNRHGQTLAVAYSVRPKPGATVATPLTWEEVKPGLSPGDFTIKNIAKRVDKVDDLWKPVIGKGIDLKKCLERLSG